MLVKVARQLATWQFKKGLKKQRRKIFGDSEENDARKKKIQKRKEQMQPTMESRDGSYRRAENCEIAVNKGHHNVNSYPLRCCNFFGNAFSLVI